MIRYTCERDLNSMSQFDDASGPGVYERQVTHEVFHNHAIQFQI